MAVAAIPRFRAGLDVSGAWVMLVLSMACAAEAAPSGQGPLVEARRFLAEGRQEDAAAVLDGWLRGHPDDPAALVERARAEFDAARSQDFYRRALRASPTGPTAPVALNGIAEFSLASGSPANAERLARQIVDGFPSSPQAPWATLLVGRARLVSGDAEGAIGEVQPLLDARDPVLRGAAVPVWAQACLAGGRAADAIPVLSAPAWASDAGILALLAEAYAATGQPARADEACARAADAREAFAANSLSGAR